MTHITKPRATTGMKVTWIDPSSDSSHSNLIRTLIDRHGTEGLTIDTVFDQGDGEVLVTLRKNGESICDQRSENLRRPKPIDFKPDVTKVAWKVAWHYLRPVE